MSETSTNILILRELSDKEWGEINSIKQSQIFSTVHNNPKIEYVALDPSEQKKIVSDFFKVMLAAGANEPKNKEEFNNALFINGIAYWYYLRFTFYFANYAAYLEKINIAKIIKKNNLKNLIIYSNFTHQIQAEYKTKKETNKVRITTWLMSFLTVFLGRAILGMFLHFKQKKEKRVILLEPYNQQKIIDIENPTQIINSDYYNEYLAQYALSQNDYIYISDYYIPKTSDKIKINKELFLNKYSKKSFYFETYLLFYLLNPYNIYKVFLFRKNLKQRINKLNSNDFHEYILPFIRSKINLLTLMHARENVMHKWAKRNKIKSITCHHEQSYHHYSLIMGARKANIISIGFQHGIIHPLHPHYIFTADDKKYQPVPDFMITWGEHWRNFLLNHSIYSPDKVVTLGQIRTDIIPKIPNIQKDENLYYVMYASQPHHRPGLRDQLTTDIFQVLKRFPNIRLIIKPHPGEKDAQEYFTQKAKEIGYDNCEITNYDLFLLLKKCDLLLTYSSTVASEAIYFRKPVFLFDKEDVDVSGYKEYAGAVFNNTSPEELYDNFNTFVNNKLDLNHTVQSKFIERFANKIDGRTCERYIEFIRSK